MKIKTLLLLLACLYCGFTQTGCQDSYVRVGPYCWACDFAVMGCQICPAVSLEDQANCLQCNEYLGFKKTPVKTPGKSDKCECVTWQDEVYRYGYGLNTYQGCYPCRYYYPGCIQGGGGLWGDKINWYTYIGACDEDHGFRPQTDTQVDPCVCLTNTSYIVVHADYDECVECSVPIPGCLTCNNSSVCLTCNTAAGFNATVASSGKCACVSGKTLNASGVCVQGCSAGCLQCPNLLSCTQCDGDHGWQYNQATSTCFCGQGYTLISGVCTNCNTMFSGCLTCTATTCSFCIAGDGFAPSQSGGCVCASGYFSVPKTPAPYPGAFTCQPCNSTMTNCITCSSGTVCTSCSIGFAVSSTQKCSPCNTLMPGCKNCSSSIFCTGCDTVAHFTLNSGNCSCVDSYYYNGSTSSCATCMPFCIRCSDSTTCNQCANTHYLTASRVCQLCSSAIVGCTKCSSQTQCNECDTASGFIYSNNQCFCPARQYLDNVARACKNCNATALTNCNLCDSATYCTSCNSNSYALTHISATQQECRNCNQTLSNCNLCNSVTYCTSCSSNAYALTQISATQQQCEPCNQTLSNCLQCSSSTTCTLCDESQNYKLLTDKTCRGCINTYFYNAQGICQICSDALFGCLKCNNNVTCLVCDGNRNFALDIQTNQCGCKRQYFLNSTNECQKINNIPGCTNMLSQTICGGCGPNFINFRTRCQCDDKFYLSTIDSTCKPCTDPNCLVCLADNQCQVCKSDYRLENNSTCIACGTYCLECNSTMCLKCKDFSYNLQKKYDCDCGKSSYPVPGQNRCNACVSAMRNCIRCNNASVCLECNLNKMVYNKKCSACRPGYYVPTNKTTCQLCSFNCLLCQGTATNCTMCPAPLQTLYPNGTCACWDVLSNQRYWLWQIGPSIYPYCGQQPPNDMLLQVYKLVQQRVA